MVRCSRRPTSMNSLLPSLRYIMATERVGMSYFTFSPTSRSKRGGSSSESSTPVSPGATISPHPTGSPGVSSEEPSVQKTNRPAFPYRPTSDFHRGHVPPYQVNISTIQEDGRSVDTGSKLAIGAQEFRAQESLQDDRRIKPSLARTPAISQSFSNSSSAKPARPVRSSYADTEVRKGSSLLTPPRRPRPGHKWSRTESGSVWYERLKNSSGHSQSSSSASLSEDVPRKLLTPLRPPLTPEIALGPPNEHDVKVETSFTDVQDDMPTAIVSLPRLHDTPDTSRKSSINPLRLFSLPLQLVRKIGSVKKKVKPVIPASSSSSASLHRRELAVHHSAMRKYNTSDALRQVSSLLRDAVVTSGATSPIAVVTPVYSRAPTDRSNITNNSHKQKQARFWGKGLASAGTLTSQKSITDFLEVASYSSSVADLRRGGMPTNTPDERATYRAKRSPSAESEEFLKIDISIRGDTSYLPSEARRAHTPPLPQDGLDGRKRGFFFDYNAPDSHDASESPALAPPQHKQDSSPKGNTCRRPTVGRRTTDLKADKPTRAKMCDWYEMKLAEIDNPENHRELAKTKTVDGHTEKLAKGKTATTPSSPLKKPETPKEGKFDMNIPEHLPTSPLCPRHPRYWRVVQGRGSQFRGCWMHGVGLNEALTPRLPGVSKMDLPI